MALNKPSLCHSSMGQSDQSLAQWIANNSPFRSELCSPPDFGLLQRLDFETSGILLAAKTRSFEELFLKHQRRGSIMKSYLTVVEGKFPEHVVIDSQIGTRSRSAKSVRVINKKLSRTRGIQDATTSAFCIGYSSTSNASLVRADIAKGARHQIRAHLSSIGHPLLGDSLYGSKSQLKSPSEKLGEELPAFLLHSHSIDISSLKAPNCQEIKAPIPDYFQKQMFELKLEFQES